MCGKDLPTMVRVWALAFIWCCIIPTTEPASTQEINTLLDFGFTIWINNSSDPCAWKGITCNNATNITDIYLDTKRLSGTFPSSIGNLSFLQNMQLGNNYLTGEIPSSISHLTSLQNLGLGTNNLTGNIPSEIGNLINLTTLYLDNNNLSGPIPPSLGNLIHLKELVLSTNFLTGTIPQEFGRLNNLNMLLLNANKLSGELPSSFSNLTNMKNLTLSNNALSGDISVLESMSAVLEKLWLQRNNFSGAIFNASFPNLQELDLGFNNFSGSLPASLAAPSLYRFFAGHNRLTGSIPSSVSTSLTQISNLDVSHNSLTGSSRMSVSPKQQDLSFNYFYNYEQTLKCDTYDAASNSSLGVCYPSITGSRTGYGINAGGDAITSGTSTFQADLKTQEGVFTGLYQVGDSNWFLQISGYAGGTVNITSEQDIYKSMRWSSTYLAYHGTELRNGRYQITLYFAELVEGVYVNYRLFDVLIQGKIVAKDLDVLRKVGQNTGYNFSAEEEVMNGTLSIEFIVSRGNYWGPKTTGPMISAIYVSPMFQVKKSKTKYLIFIILGAAASILVLLSGLTVVLIRRRRKANRNLISENESGCSTAIISKIGPTVYTYKQLLQATEGFNEKLMLGKGGFGAVYKGTLADGSVVAIKQLTKKTKKSAETFKKEIAILSMIQHRNLVGIKGYCLNSGISLLVCDFIENGSLETFLFKGPVLNWQARRKIAIGAACGLQYLHEGSRYQVIHCDIKPANILLDKELNACIGDFGLAKLYKERVTHVIATKLAGTIGYIAPEYSASYELSEKIDVYSFGVVLLELVSGKRAISDNFSYAVSRAQEMAYVEPNNLLNLVDEKLDGEFDKQEALDMSTIAVLCTQTSPDARPRMRDVWLMLNNTIPVPPLQVQPQQGVL